LGGTESLRTRPLCPSIRLAEEFFCRTRSPPGVPCLTPLFLRRRATLPPAALFTAGGSVPYPLGVCGCPQGPCKRRCEQGACQCSVSPPCRRGRWLRFLRRGPARLEHRFGPYFWVPFGAPFFGSGASHLLFLVRGGGGPSVVFDASQPVPRCFWVAFSS